MYPGPPQGFNPGYGPKVSPLGLRVERMTMHTKNNP